MVPHEMPRLCGEVIVIQRDAHQQRVAGHIVVDLKGKGYFGRIGQGAVPNKILNVMRKVPHMRQIAEFGQWYLPKVCLATLLILLTPNDILDLLDPHQLLSALLLERP